MRALALAALLPLTTPADACHRFSVWKYPYAQRCQVAKEQVDKSWSVEFVLPDVGAGAEAKPMALPRFTVSKYDTIILTPKPGRTDEEGRADAIEILRQVMGQ